MLLSDIARALGAQVAGDASLNVARLVHPADATGHDDLAMALAGDAIPALADTRAHAAVIKPGTAVRPGISAISFGGHERMALAILTRLFDHPPAHEPGVHPTASVAPDARVAEGASIGPLVSVGARSTIAAGSVISAGASIGTDVTIGRDCLVHPGARVGDRVRLGDRVVIQANAVVGADGFSFIPVRNPDGTKNPLDLPARVHSLGGVVVGDDVEIGAGTTIDRGTLRDTRIGRGTKIDNQVQIAHNVVIGEACIVCGMVGIAGSATIGDRVILAAGSGVGDHVTVGADVTVSALAGVISDVAPGTLVDGVPALPRQQAAERFLNIGRLKTLYPRVEELKRRIDTLEKGSKGG
jgi:UDP-3-O-[3-hydroxymyristoyl] glucosamine N-acyltransferase